MCAFSFVSKVARRPNEISSVLDDLITRNDVILDDLITINDAVINFAFFPPKHI